MDVFMNTNSTTTLQDASMHIESNPILDNHSLHLDSTQQHTFKLNNNQTIIQSSLSAFNKTLASSQAITLTPSQESTVNMCIRLIPEFKILVIKGESSSGKYVVASELFKRLNAIVELFDLCELAKQTSRDISNQDIVGYLDSLCLRLNEKALLRQELEKVESSVLTKDTCHKRRRLSTSNSIYHNDNGRRDYSTPKIIYIRHYNRVADVLTDCYAKVRFLLPLILKTFSERMGPDIRIVLTTQGCLLPEGLHWCTDLTTTRQDMEHVLRQLGFDGTISRDEFHYIMKISKIVPVGRILYCIRYAIAMSRNDPSRHHNIDESLSSQFKSIDMNEISGTQTAVENNIFIESYKKALSKFSGSTVDVDKDVPKPIPEDDLVGVETIMDEITTSIINPMELCIPGIPLKKGLLLCGPPGTGKTSIGRWLAHKIKGKFYSIGGDAGINGPSLVDAFQNTIKRAHDNSPAVVFIDDGDVLFDHDDTYRAFLTILDGIETNKRSDVCVIVTCMNMRNVPASLLRGGRLEMALVTRLPDRKKIQLILERSLDKMKKILHDYDPYITVQISKYFNKSFIGDISGRMTGWNCADIHRCVNDVSRLIVAGKGTNLTELFHHCIKQITDQYLLCGKCESTNLDYRPHDTYIS